MPYAAEYSSSLRSRFPTLSWTEKLGERNYDVINVQQFELGRKVVIHFGFNTRAIMHGIKNRIHGTMPEPSIFVSIQVDRATVHWNDVVKRFETASGMDDERAFIGTPPLKCILVKRLERNLRKEGFQMSDPFTAECLDWHENRTKTMLEVLQVKY